jgi:TolB-like protein/DNA-binding winged helix-turn-helix (wHTH) protein/Flp pilus assembly protein TadD
VVAPDERLILCFGPYELDVAARELRREGEEIFVQSRVFDLLVHLARNHDRMVDRDELQEAVWPGRVITDAAMTRAIMIARKAVDDDASEQKIIKTLHGQGYRFVAEIETVVPEARDSEPAAGSEADIPTTRRRPRRRRKPLLGLAAVVLVVGVIAVFLDPWRSADPPADAAYPPNSIAVLPFVNMSDDPANEYFSDGVSEELLNLLAKIPELRVVSRSSAFYFKDKDLKLADIARELNVAHILEGSVRKAGNDVRITAQLIETSTDTHLWSETFDRSLDDIFNIQDEIAVAVVGALKLTLLGETPQADPIDPEAFSLYLQARYLNAQATADSFEQATELYRQALAIEPGFARAWRGLAVIYTNQANKGLRRRDESYALAREAIDRALSIDPDFAMAHAMLGMFAMAYEGDLNSAASHLEHALSLEPTNPVLISYASSLLLRLGRLDEAVTLRERDVLQDPLDPIGHNNLAWAYLLAGRLDEAIATSKTLLMLAPNYGSAYNTWGRALLFKGESDAALEVMRQETSEVWRLMGLVTSNHALGHSVESDEALRLLIDGYGQERAYHIASVLAYRGEADRSFEWLEKARQSASTSLTYIAVEPLFADLHDDPRWLPFLEQCGMSAAQLGAIRFRMDLID